MNHQRQAFVFALIRYVNDVFSGEFLNVGIVSLAPKSGQLEVRISKNFVRIMQAFPTAKLGALSSQLTHMERTLRSLQCADGHSFQSLMARVLPEDESCLQLSSSSSGVTADLAKSVTELFERFVLNAESSSYGEVNAYGAKRNTHQFATSRTLSFQGEDTILAQASNEEACYEPRNLVLAS